MRFLRYAFLPLFFVAVYAPHAAAQAFVLERVALEAPDDDGGFGAITTLINHFAPSGRLDSVTTEGFDFTTFQFGVNRIAKLAYASGPEAGQQTITETISQRRSGVLELDEQTVTVEANGLPLMVTTSLWDGSAWVPSRRETTTYDDGAPRFVLKEDWSDGQWVVVGRTAVSENANPQELVIAEEVQLSDGTWIPQFRFRRDGQRVEDLLALSEAGTTGLLRAGIFAPVPLSAEDVRLFTPGFARELSDGMGGWLPNERAVAEYDGAGRITSLAYQRHVGGTEPWVLEDSTAIMYDAQGRLDTVTYYDEDAEYDGDFVYAYDAMGQVETATFYSLDDGERVLDVRYAFTWRDAATFTAAERTESLAANALSAAFPNPTADRAAFAVTLDMPGEARVTVYDVLGRTVAVLHDGSLAAGTQPFAWDAGALPSGVYLVRLETARGSAIRPLTVAR